MRDSLRPGASLSKRIVIDLDVPQTVVQFGGLGVKRSDPDFYAAALIDYILGGGGFASRLTQEVREKRGLTYGIDVSLAPLDHGGHHRPQEAVGRLEAALDDRVQVVDRGLQEAADDDHPRERGGRVEAAEPVQRGGDQPLGGAVGREVPGALDHLDLGAGGGELVDQRGVGIAQHEVVAALGEEPGQ